LNERILNEYSLENYSPSRKDSVQNNENQKADMMKDQPSPVQHDKKKNTKSVLGIPLTDNYYSWLNITLHLASQSPSDLLSLLESQDSFQVRTFDMLLIQQEIQHGRSLTQQELRQLFPCPPNGQRLTLPSFINHTKAKLFRDNTKASSNNSNNNGYFLFFQHLRKAGGTHFCSLAQANLLPNFVPSYYCMPDWDWSHYKTAGYLHSYTNQQLIQYQQEKGWRIAGNEWEPFRTHQDRDDDDDDSHLHLPAVLATLFRKPLHRALSQFRFECLENRGRTIKNVTEWWQVDGGPLKNVYLSTFADITQLYGFYHTCHDRTRQAIQQRKDYMKHAMTVLSQFHLILIME